MNVLDRADIFTSTRTYIVIPSNCRGTHGAGLSKTAAQKYPDLCATYTLRCREDVVRPGHIYQSGGRLIFANTKDHWKDPSQFHWIESICKSLAIFAGNSEASLAIPALGCGLGGLPWSWVEEELFKWFKDDDLIDVYAPHGIRRHRLALL